MGLVFLRLFFILIFTAIGYSIGGDDSLAFAIAGCSFGVMIVLFEVFSRKVSLKGLSSAVFGIVLGLIIAWIFGETIDQFPLAKDLSPEATSNVKLFVTFIFVY